MLKIMLFVLYRNNCDSLEQQRYVEMNTSARVSVLSVVGLSLSQTTDKITWVSFNLCAQFSMALFFIFQALNAKLAQENSKTYGSSMQEYDDDFRGSGEFLVGEDQTSPSRDSAEVRRNPGGIALGDEAVEDEKPMESPLQYLESMQNKIPVFRETLPFTAEVPRQLSRDQYFNFFDEEAAGEVASTSTASRTGKKMKDPMKTDLSPEDEEEFVQRLFSDLSRKVPLEVWREK